MTEKDKFIEKIVKGMKDNKRSLIQRYGNDAEKVMYAVANKKWDEKMKTKNSKEDIKEIIKKVLSEQKQKLKEVRELTDEEYKIAKEFATKKGGKLAAMGADDKALYLSLTMPGKKDEVEFKIDKTGKELNEATDREVFERMEELANKTHLKEITRLLFILTPEWLKEGFETEDIQLYMNYIINKIIHNTHP